MPAPFTIVTILDADGDEFPIRLDGVTCNTAADKKAALQELETFEREGLMRPTRPLRAPREWRITCQGGVA